MAYYTPNMQGVSSALPTLYQQPAPQQPERFGYLKQHAAFHKMGQPSSEVGKVPPPQVGGGQIPPTPVITPPQAQPPQIQGQGTVQYTPPASATVPYNQRYDQYGFPRVSEVTPEGTRYFDGSWAASDSPNALKALQVRGGLQPEAQGLWDKLPESWKQDLAGRDPRFIAAYLDAVLRGNSQQAQSIYQQSGDYQQAQKQGAQKPPLPQIQYKDAPYYVPNR